jgi:STAS-like domain of unknown function (DUF4325)
MRFEMKKFGIILNSRPAGQEAVLRVKQIANGIGNNELVFDFSGVEVLTPSFADEFFSGLRESFKDKNIVIKAEGYAGNTVIEDVLKQFSLITA